MIVSVSEDLLSAHDDNLINDSLITGSTIDTISCEDPVDTDKREFSYILAILFGLPALVIIFVTVFGNFLVLCFKARVGKHQTTLLIWNLGLADFMVGIFVLPLGVLNVVAGKWYFGRLLCKIWTACDVVFCTASIVTLCIISVDRYIGVTRPLRYKLIVTKTKVKLANCGIWFFSITILLATVKYTDDVTECYNPDICAVSYELAHVVHSVVFAFFLPATVTLLLYWKIYSVAKKREKGLMQGLMMAMGDNFLRDCFSVPLRMHCGKDNHMSQQQQIIKMHKKVAKTLGVVVSAFLLCWLPFFSLYLISYHCGDCIPNLVLDISTWFGYTNSCINPLIYAFTLSEFRKSVRTIFQAVCQLSKCRKGPQYANCMDPSLTARSSQGVIVPRSDRAYSIPVAPGVDACGDDRLKVHRPSKAPSSSEMTSFTTVAIANESYANLTPPTPTSSKRLVAAINGGGDNARRVSRQGDRLSATLNSSNLHIDRGNVVTELVWSAKLYAMLISPQSTRL